MKLLTDVHTHSAFSHDGIDELSTMLAAALEKGVAFYGVSEHFDYDLCAESVQSHNLKMLDEEGYFHAARHLQEDYAGCMNVLVGAEFGYSEDEKVWGRYAATYEKHRPDFVVNSVHCKDGWDYHSQRAFYTQTGGEPVLRPKEETLAEYFALVEKSLDAPYPYDIVGHLGYAARYAPYDEKEIKYAEFSEQIDRVLLKIVEKGKILEVNTSTYGLKQRTLPSAEILARYFELGGRNVSFASDAHSTDRILKDREYVVQTLKELGFTYITVPCRGEYVRVDL